MELFFWIFLGITFANWVIGWAVCCRFRKVPPVEPGNPIPAVRISVIIPARNEEANLSRLLPSLRDQEFAPLEIIVVDDQSTDQTAKIAEEQGAKVIRGSSPPAGWLGKPWACWQGADAAEGDWLLFLDADTALDSSGLLRIAHLSGEENAVHSICPWHEVKEPYEQLSAFFNVIMVLGMNAFTWKGKEAGEIGLFGQAMFLSKSNYHLSGGHEAVKNEVLENFHLARHVAEKGMDCRCYLGRGTITMRMFPGGTKDLVAGWSKGFISGANNTPGSALAGISLWLSALIMSTIALTFLPLASMAADFAVAILYGLGVLQSLFLFRSVGSYSLFTAVFFPIPLFFYQVLFFGALRRKKQGGKVKWKGRDVG